MSEYGTKPPVEPWRRNQIAVTSAAGLIFFGFTLVMPFLPYFVESLGVHGKAVDVWSGVLLSAAPFLAALMAPLWGRIAHRYGMRRMVQRTLLAMTIHWVLIIFVWNVWQLLVLRILLGVFSGFSTISIALVTLGVPREKIGSVVGTLQSVQILSAATGPFFGGFLYDTIGLRATFAITAVLCFAGLLLVSSAYNDLEIETEEGTAEAGDPARGERDLAMAGRSAPRRARFGVRQVLAIPGILPILFVLFWATVVSRSFGLITPLFLQELTTDTTLIGLLSGVTVSMGSYAEAVSAWISGRLSGRQDPRKVLMAGLTCAVPCAVALFFVGDPWEFLLLRVLLGLVAGGTMTLGYTLGGDLLPDRGRAVSYSVLSSAAMLGGSMGPTLSGLISWAAGIRYNFLLAAALYSIMATMTLVGLKRKGLPGVPPAPPDPGEKPYIPIPR